MILNIECLKKSFEQVEVLNIPRLTINNGELVGILGNNGAGKTTLFRLCLDLLKADAGSVAIENEKVNNSTNWKTITSAYIDEHFLIDFLTPKEYFYFTSDLYGIGKEQIDIALSNFVSFAGDEIFNQKKYIDKFSKGNKQKIGIIGAMLIRPQLLILDEPFNFLDPSSQIRMKNLLQEYNQKYGTTILLSSHNIQHVTDICNRIIVLESGRIIMDEMHPDETFHRELQGYFQRGTIDS
jgi:ABC-2 type transport system ATP-binding protein